jgi:hypothetical protein
MASTQQTQIAQKPEKYETPEIVAVGRAIELTSGMGGDSKDMDGWTIPVQPKQASKDTAAI